MIASGIINLAIKKAKSSDHKFKHGCVIFSGKRIISSGNNKKRSVKSIDKSARKYNTSVHAEIESILKARKNLNNMSILIVRDSLAMSLPCKTCMSYIKKLGIKKIYYSDNGKIYKY